jgi:predicted permease
MEAFWFSFNAIAPLMLLVATGHMVRRTGLIDDVLNQKANRFLFQVAFPVSLFVNIAQTDLAEYFSWRLTLFTLGMILAVIIFLMLFVPRFISDRKMQGAFVQGVYRGNYLLLGYPLARNLFGEAGVGPTAMLLPMVIALYNLMAVIILEYYSDEAAVQKPGRLILSILKNPLIIGAAAGVIFAVLPVDLPVFALRTLKDIAGIANPLALILLGSQISWQKISNRLTLVISAALLRLIIIPVIIIGLAVLIGFRGPELGAVFVLFCAPTAVSSYIMAKNMNSDSDLAAQIIVITTAFSGLSLFLAGYILKSLQYI